MHVQVITMVPSLSNVPVTVAVMVIIIILIIIILIIIIIIVIIIISIIISVLNHVAWKKPIVIRGHRLIPNTKVRRLKYLHENMQDAV